MSIVTIYNEINYSTPIGFKLTRVDAFQYTLHKEGLCSALVAFFVGRKVSSSEIPVCIHHTYKIDNTLSTLLKTRHIETPTTAAKNERVKQDIDELSKKNNQLKNDNARLETENKDIIGKNYDRDSVTILKDYDNTISVLKSEITSMEKTCSELQSEYEKALTKFSALAGDRLKNNNPSITDLDDKTRPMRVEQRYKDLYGNQVTDLLVQLSKDHEFTEKERYLLIFDTFHSLHNKIESLIGEALNKKLLDNKTTIQKEEEATHENGSKDKPSSSSRTPHLSAHKALNLMRQEVLSTCDTKRTTNDSVLKNALESIKNEEKEKFLKELNEENANKIAKDIIYLDAYLNESALVLFYGLAQKPPMHFTFKQTVFNPNHLVKITSGCDEVDFVVWPSLHLHQESTSPALMTGVAFPKINDK